MTALPAEVQTAFQTLIEFERLDLAHKSLLLNRFSKAQTSLRNYLRNNPSSPHAERVRRNRAIYMKSFLRETSDVEMDIVAWFDLVMATHDLRMELNPSFDEEPDLRIAWHDIMGRFREHSSFIDFIKSTKSGGAQLV